MKENKFTIRAGSLSALARQVYAGKTGRLPALHGRPCAALENEEQRKIKKLNDLPELTSTSAGSSADLPLCHSSVDSLYAPGRGVRSCEHGDAVVNMAWEALASWWGVSLTAREAKDEESMLPSWRARLPCSEMFCACSAQGRGSAPGATNRDPALETGVDTA